MTSSRPSRLAITSLPPATRIATVVAIAGLLALGYRFVVGPPELVFSDIDTPAGFRRLVGANGEAGQADFSPMAALPGATGGTNGQIAPQPERDDNSLCRALYFDDLAPASGSSEPGVTIVEFTDYQCPYCRRLSGILAKIEDNQPDIRHIYKHWPILGPDSVLAARAALAANRQGVHTPFHRRMMRTRFRPTPAFLGDIASELGIDLARFESDRADPALDGVFAANDSAARKLGFVGTPGLIVGRTIVEGAIDESRLQALIALEREEPADRTC